MHDLNSYDRMITNIEKDWITTQMHSNTKEKWETPQYSKSQINKAGKIISDNSSSDKEKSDEEKKEAIIILNNWRASHAYPLQVIASNLRINNKDAIVVQRLKRLDSIIGKLKRFPEMSLYGMQDLGGCRVITNTISEVYEALNRYKSSRIRHEVKREDDYIKYPKASGYRGYHAVFLFHSDKNEVYNKNMRIEVQFRTTLQHTWATAVEVMGIYTKTALKASMGDIDTLRFFVLASSVFAQIEKSPIVPGTSEDYSSLIKEIRDIDRHQNIVSRLSALSTAISHISKK